MAMQPLPMEEQDAVEKLTGAVPGIGAGAAGQGGGDPLPEGSLKLSAPNFLSKAARKDLYRGMTVLGALTIVLGFTVILLAHNDATDNWVWPSLTLLLIGLGAWIIAYVTVGGFGNVEVTVGAAGGDGAATPPAAGPTVDPKDGANEVAVDSVVTVTFATAVDPETISNESFKLTGPDGAAVPAAVAYDVAKKMATLTPNAALVAKTKYTAAFTEDVAGLDGTNLVAKSWTFTTA
jgi:Bacterial Ig-like domain